MTPDAPPPPLAAAPDGRIALPRHTTPTWEIELLLSGAVVFALFQLPGPVHAVAADALARLGESGRMLVILGLVYALLAIYALIGTFLAHLTARAYWIALVGLHSVYPHGVRWERYNHTPIARAEAERRLASPAVTIERADNFASLCFALGLLVAMSTLLGGVVALPAALIAIALSSWLFDGQHIDTLLYVMMAVLVAPLLGAGLVDAMLARRTPGGGVPQGRLARVVAAIYRFSPNRLIDPLMLPLLTNRHRGAATGAFFGAMLLLVAALIIDFVSRSDRFALDGARYLPAGAAEIEADRRFYREFRAGDAAVYLRPSIDAQVIDGAWLRLFVPYRPERHDPWFEHRCLTDREAARALARDIAGKRGSPARSTAEATALTCLLQELDIRLDGRPAVGIDALFASDPDTGQRGVLVMVPVAELGRGRHTLSLNEPPRRSAWNRPERLREHEAQGALTIPFWR